jgi:hypothetical protein
LRRVGILATSLAVLAACGYRVQSSVKALPHGIQSLGIPVFTNLSQQYRLEQRITGAVLKEFSTRTRVPVNPSPTGVDAVLQGEIRTVNSSPVTFGSDTFGSAFLVTVQMAVKLVRVADSAVLWENNNFLYRERYVLNRSVGDFFFEENPALDRLARDFASSLVSTILNQ